MCSIITHPIVPLAIAPIFPRQMITPTITVAGAILSIVPDLDVIGFGFGIRYGDVLGHRGLTHSILFAASLAAILTAVLAQGGRSSRLIVFVFLFLSTLSHAILDAMTDGGLGVALFAPFQNGRYFFPWRPITVSPIGAARFFSEAGLRVLWSELWWVWLPSAAVYSMARIWRRSRRSGLTNAAPERRQRADT
jgi:inner membrane protein